MTDLRVLADAQDLARAGAELFYRKLEASLRSHGLFAVALSGGETPRRMFDEIARAVPPGIDWSRVHLFWTDERDVPAGDPRSCFGLARRHLLKGLPIPLQNLHRFKTELGRPADVVADYERELRSFFVDLGRPRFDLVFLGLGEDGHTASLFPGALPAAGSAWAASVEAPQAKASVRRYTLTPAALNAAAELVFLVSGEGKATILREVLDPGPCAYPVRLIAPERGKLLWLADRSAAAEVDTAYAQDPLTTISRIANQLRIHSIRATTAAGSGHPTSCASAADLVAALFFSQLRFDPLRPHAENNDRFILSKGHAAPLLYAAWAEAGAFDPTLLESLRKLDSPFEGHPTPRLDFVDVATGSLGQGLGAGVGMAIHARMRGLPFRTYVLMGDGELAEGSVWEAASLAGTRKLGNLCAILDINRFGQSQETAFGDHAEVYRARFEAFGWKTKLIDGHSPTEIISAFEDAFGDTALPGAEAQPFVIVARTLKGKGIRIAEDKPGWHGKALTRDQARQAIGDLEAHAQSAEGWNPRLPTPVEPDETVLAPPLADGTLEPLNYDRGKPVATRKAAGQALERLGARDSRIVVLDGDVENSTHTDLFGQKFPERFVECYIAEQNMVSVSMGLSALGRTPFSSTFAAFYSRALDQLRMAGVSRANIKMIGTHAGISIGEDGPSQMALEDLAAMRAIVGSRVLYPCDAVSTQRLVELMARERGIFYLRASRPETPILYAEDEAFELGGAKVLRQTGQDAVTVVAAGVTVFEALRARDQLAEEGLPFTVIDAYSIKPLAADLIWETAQSTRNPGVILTVEDHYLEGGLGDTVAGELSPRGARVHKLAVRELPHSGTQAELMARYGIDASAIIGKVRELAGRSARFAA